MANDTMEALSTSYNFINDTFFKYLDKFVIAIIILLIGFIIARIVGRLTKKILSELEVDYILKKAAGVKFSLEKTVSRSLEYFIYFLAVVLTLNQLGVTTTVLHLIAGAIILIIAVSFILAVKDFIPNLIAGFMIYQRKRFKPGDRIKVGEVEGKIKSITLLETRIITKSGDTILIPNSTLTKGVVKKKARSSRAR